MHNLNSLRRNPFALLPRSFCFQYKKDYYRRDNIACLILSSNDVKCIKQMLVERPIWQLCRMLSSSSKDTFRACHVFLTWDTFGERAFWICGEDKRREFKGKYNEKEVDCIKGVTSIFWSYSWSILRILNHPKNIQKRYWSSLIGETKRKSIFLLRTFKKLQACGIDTILSWFNDFPFVQLWSTYSRKWEFLRAKNELILNKGLLNHSRPLAARPLCVQLFK